ncbi:multicopper oxidase [Glonium stellatum]|uniref:Multicopper oxidase n=1 Tax=Glonium stellatum TaxID=574774 RepID=A0A8E2F5L0_9PEZI|nr:multicopper oxidase [Glonium stellatum]
MDGLIELRRRTSQSVLTGSASGVSTPSAPSTQPQPQPQPLIAPSSPHRLRSAAYFVSLLAIALVLSSAASLFYLRHGSFNPPLPLSNSTPSTQASAEARRALDIILSPQNHISRPPNTFHYNWTVTAGLRRPDGVTKRVYLINDQFPGPTLEARSGDTLIIRVENALEDEGLSIHWHGLHMRGQNEFDGADGLTQCPVAPGASFTYQIAVSNEQHGTFWYHAHQQVQRADGLYGGLIVHKPVPQDAPDSYRIRYDEERLLLIGDWYHRPADDVLKWYMRAGSFGMEPVPDSMLINGLGSYNCSLAVPARPVDCLQLDEEQTPGILIDPTKRYRYRIINTGSLSGITVRIEEAAQTAIEVDGGHPVKANPAYAIGVLHPGERVDTVVTWPHSQNQLAMLQVVLDDESFRYPNSALRRTQAFPITLTPTSSSSSKSVEPAPPDIQASIDIQQALPEVSPEHQPFPQNANQTLVIYTTTLKLARLSNVPHGFMNHTSYKPQSNPPQPVISLPREAWDKNQFIPYISTPTEPIWVDIVINNLDDGGHPFHLHGHDFYILATHAADHGWGSYNPFSPAPPPGGAFNLVNPAKKDTVFIPRHGYAVLRFLADNPGIWMLHCHLLWHQASGMAMGLHVGSDEARAFPGDEERAQRASRLCVRNST